MNRNGRFRARTLDHGVEMEDFKLYKIKMSLILVCVCFLYICFFYFLLHINFFIDEHKIS